MNLQPFDRCSCPKARSTGRTYYSALTAGKGWLSCLNCGYLIPRTSAERASLDARENAEVRARRSREILTDDQVLRIVTRELRQAPTMSNSKLRNRVSELGNYDRCEAKFSRLARDVRDFLGIEPSGNGRVS